jgi:hypothetical protein
MNDGTYAFEGHDSHTVAVADDAVVVAGRETSQAMKVALQGG